MSTVGETPQLPPTIVFNEGWLLRLSLDCLSRLSLADHPLSFAPKATWFSEALLPTAFRPRTRADKLSESYTHADGAIGHIKVAKAGSAYLGLDKEAIQFIITEAKMFSALSTGVKNAPFFNQAARSVACMAQVLCRDERPVDQFASLGFYVIAPEVVITAGVFNPQMTREHVQATIAERVRGYDGTLDEWYNAWFIPLIHRIDLRYISWEDIVTLIESKGDPAASELKNFYQNCLKYNRPRKKT